MERKKERGKIYVFDDGPELAKLKEWYDQIRDNIQPSGH
jgi:hypothetical protein